MLIWCFIDLAKELATDTLKLNANLPRSNRQTNLAESFIILPGLGIALSFGRDDGGQLTACKSLADNQGVDTGLVPV